MAFDASFSGSSALGMSSPLLCVAPAKVRH
jgi:hypothetical protein